MTDEHPTDPGTPDRDATGDDAPEFVGRTAGQDEGYAEETGAERREQE
jgi:hypothetical protein